MNDNIRILFLKICESSCFDHQLHEITTRLYYLDTHFPPEKLESALLYLVKNKLTGTKFLHWFQSDCTGSNLEMHRKLMAAVERERHTRKLYAANDLRIQ